MTHSFVTEIAILLFHCKKSLKNTREKLEKKTNNTLLGRKI